MPKIGPFLVGKVDIDRSGGHGGSAKLTLRRYGFVDQTLYVEPEEGENLEGKQIFLLLDSGSSTGKVPPGKIPSCS
jgi:hypothetical protein